MLHESSRRIKKGGSLIIIDLEKSQSPFGPHAHQRIDHINIKEASEIAGLEIIDKFKPGSYHYGIILRKNN